MQFYSKYLKKKIYIDNIYIFFDNNKFIYIYTKKHNEFILMDREYKEQSSYQYQFGISAVT